MVQTEIQTQGQQYCEAFLAAYRSSCATSPESEAQHRQLLNRFVEEGVNAGNFGIVNELFASNYVSHSPLGNLNREEVAATLSAMRDALSDFEMSVPSIFLDGDRAATLRVIKGTFDHEMASPNGAIPPNGQPVQVEMVCMLRFDEDGLLAEDWTQFDNLGFLTQLGALPAPGQ